MRIAVWFLIAAMAVGMVSAQDDGGGYVVLLKDGASIPAKAKPISAFGKLRYLDADGRMRVLPASRVDLKKTREANASVPSEGKGGTLSVAGTTQGQNEDDDERLMVGVAADESKADKKAVPSVKVYSATWCPHCNSLKKFLAAEGIAASVIEVDRLFEGEQMRTEAEMKRLTGRVAFPTVVVGDQAKAGFSPGWIRDALKR